MSKQIDALNLALEALEWATSCMSFDDFDDMPEALEELNKAHEAITAIKEALATEAQQSGSVSNEQVEPVAYRYMYITEPDLGFWFDEEPTDLSYLKCEPLYTHPPVPYVTESRTAQPEQEKKFAKLFSQMKSENEPCSEVLALGQMMREWLQHQVSDNGSCVDTGKGFSEYDLWVMCEGKELFITIKEKRPTK